MTNTKNQLSLVTVIIISIIVVFTNIKFIPLNILSWDVFGYYLYLPMLLIYNDLGLTQISELYEIIEKYQNTNTLYQAIKADSGNWIVLYHSGLAILYSPFYFIGHIIALSTEYPANGFSKPYQYAILSGGILYTLAGIYYLRKILLHFFKDGIVSITLLIIVFGTNFYFHTSFHGQNAMSHNYLFTLYTLIIFLTINWYKSHKPIHICLLAVCCGLAILSRPSDIVCLIIPLFWGVHNKSSFFHQLIILKKYKYQVLSFVIILFLIGSLQLIYWKIYTNTFFYFSYSQITGDGLDLLDPNIFQVLFSFRKGWLVYTPIMFFSIIGFYYLYKKNKSFFFPIILFFILNLYIVSSWSCWWYANSFSQRSLIQSYAVLAIPLGYFIHALAKKNTITKTLVSIVLIGLTFLNLFQTYQAEKGIIHGSRMTKNYYMSIFGKTSVDSKQKKLLLVNRSFDGNEKFTPNNNYHKTIEEIYPIDTLRNKNLTTQYNYTIPNSIRLDNNNRFSPSFKYTFNDLTKKDHAWIKGSVMVYPTSEPESNQSYFVFTFQHKKKNYKYKTLDFKTQKLKLHEWNKITFDYLTPEVRNKKDKFSMYVWHTGPNPIFIDDLKIEVYEPLQ